MNRLIVLSLIVCLFIGTNANAKPVSLRQKIGQMLIIGFEGKTINTNSPVVKAIDEDNIGGVILFDFNQHTQTFDKNIETPNQVRALNTSLQQTASEANLKHHRPSLPLLISVDYEGGKVNRLRAEYGFPGTKAAAHVGKMNRSNANNVAHDLALTLKTAGFNLDFAPVLDVNVNPDNPIMGKLDRSFSDNPDDIAKYAGLYSQQLLSQKVQCAYKHFPGHGSSTGDSHLGFVDVSETWQPQELKPYSQLLGHENACGMIMSAHVVNRQLDESGLPATLSHKILTGLLRDKLHFNGVIITDDMQMQAIRAQYSLEKAITLAINAGADMFIFGNQLSDTPQDPKQIIDLIEAKVKSGEISEQRIDDAYQHIVRLKKTIQ